MRIKRFQAPDMRTALRLIRDEHGPDAVILSNRPVEGGIEVVSAIDYDETLVSQALRAAAPALEPVMAAAPVPPAVVPAAATLPDLDAAASFAAFLASHSQPATAAGATPIDAATPALPKPALAPAAAAAPTPAAAATVAAARPDPLAPRESLLARARAALRRADEEGANAPTLDEILAQAPAPARAAVAQAPAIEAIDLPQASAAVPVAEAASPAAPASAPAHAVPAIDTPRALQGVAAPDPAIVAMREELARMRQMMEAQMEQLALERLRGSPGRAAAIDALTGFGCEAPLAQAVAARLDPRLAPADIHAPMRAELARMLTVANDEPIAQGGVIALVGPTGAGKTTTAAKLAARYAARHGARDVALVTTDLERAGATEQLHALGRRLGITVCEAAGPDGLQRVLAQLADYPLVLVDTTGHAPRDRAVFSQILWLRSARSVRSLLVLPANAHPHDLGEVIRRYRPAAPEGVVLTKLDESGRPGAVLSVAARHGLVLAYTSGGQDVPSDLEPADAERLVAALEPATRAADNPFVIEDRHAAV